MMQPGYVLADRLRRERPAIVRSVEAQHGLALGDVLTRRGMPECQEAIRTLVYALADDHWPALKISIAIGSPVEAITSALRRRAKDES